MVDDFILKKRRIVLYHKRAGRDGDADLDQAQITS